MSSVGIIRSRNKDLYTNSFLSFARCSCKIDCSGHNENPVCGTDGNSYNNPCLVREASCLKQEQIDVKHLGRCPGRIMVDGLVMMSQH